MLLKVSVPSQQPNSLKKQRAENSLILKKFVKTLKIQRIKCVAQARILLINLLYWQYKDLIVQTQHQLVIQNNKQIFLEQLEFQFMTNPKILKRLLQIWRRDIVKIHLLLFFVLQLQMQI
ncbi:hypothetical protein FGO68_gene9570 [Halteria grandinella]|uniref:Uncharacterized protein n=1 Tax=Halteria grandinella TaxID=5974 RepID=A0A8J8NBA4_HALGN|nr:hypothetical protein FGO68_gene9570 [Halteria grandinella]